MWRGCRRHKFPKVSVLVYLLFQVTIRLTFKNVYQVDVSHLAPGAHSVRVVPVLVAPALPGGLRPAWARDSVSPALESRVWVSRGGCAGDDRAEEVSSAASGIDVQVEVVSIWGLAVTAQVTVLARSAAVRTHVRDALLSRAAPLVLALDVSHESPTLRFPFSLAAHHLIVAAPGSAADAGGAAGGGKDVARVNVTVLAVSADEQGRVAMNVSVWGREGLGLAHSLGASGVQRGGSGADSREVLLATDVGVVLRGGGVQRGDGAAGEGGRGGGTVEDEGWREEAEAAQESEAEADAEYEYAATTEALFCRAVELSLQDLLPPWLSFLSSGAWVGRGGLRAGGRRAGAWSGAARWEKVKVGGSEWRVRLGAQRLSNALVASWYEGGGGTGKQGKQGKQTFVLGPLRVLELVGTQWRGGGALEVSFHVRSLDRGGVGKGGAGEGNASMGEMETMDWLVVRAVSRDALVPASISRVASGQYHVRYLVRRGLGVFVPRQHVSLNPKP